MDAFPLAGVQEYCLRLMTADEHVRFVANVPASPMPASFVASREQIVRWEAGRWDPAWRWTPTLIPGGVVGRDRVRLHDGLEQLLLPQSVLRAAHNLALTATLGIQARRVIATKLLSVVRRATVVLCGLRAHA